LYTQLHLTGFRSWGKGKKTSYFHYKTPFKKFRIKKSFTHRSRSPRIWLLNANSAKDVGVVQSRKCEGASHIRVNQDERTKPKWSVSGKIFGNCKGTRCHALGNCKICVKCGGVGLPTIKKWGVEILQWDGQIGQLMPTRLAQTSS
jgi:hypothetical protein